jgi:type VI secretion system ImpH/TssG family protein
MAPAHRPPAHHLNYLAEVGREVSECGLFPVVRAAEARAQGMPRVGNSRRPAQNVVDLAQHPSLVFPGPTLAEIRRKGDRVRISGYWLGLTGPMGALPTHLTEFAAYERRYAKTQPFGDFLDLLAGRMLQLFYRSWADSQPAAHADRVDDDRFAFYLGALSGACEGVSPDAAFPGRGRLHYAGHFASRRSAGAIRDALSHLLGTAVAVAEFQPRWSDVEVEDRSRLGRSFATLGRDVMLGRRVRTASEAFRVHIRAPDLRTYRKLLPSGRMFPLVAEALDALAPSHLEWDVALEIDHRDVVPARLDGQTALGWSSWLAPKRAGIRSDAHLKRRKLRDRRQGADA